MTRLFIAATAFLGLVAVTTQEASALTSSTRRCIAQARETYRDALRTSRATLLNTFRTNYSGCFGPGSDCAKNCQTEQLDCQEGPGSPTERRANCINDVDQSGVDQLPNQESCRNKFDKAIAPCQDIVDDAEAELCARNARLARFDCNQACAKAVQAELDACNFAFGDCVQACASRR